MGLKSSSFSRPATSESFILDDIKVNYSDNVKSKFKFKYNEKEKMIQVRTFSGDIFQKGLEFY